MTEFQTVNGWRFPTDAEVPTDTWSKGKAGGEEFYVFHWAGFVDVARQMGLEGTETRVTATGEDEDGIPYVAVMARVTIDGETYEAIGSADAPENSLSDMASTAQSRALKRAIRVALGIRRINEPPEEPTAVADADVDFEEGHALNEGTGDDIGEADGW